MPGLAPDDVASRPSTGVTTARPSGGDAPDAARPATFALIGSPGAPGGIAVAPDGRVYVTTDNGTARGMPGPSKVFTFDSSGGLVGDLTVAGQPDGHRDGLGAVVADPADGIPVVIDRATGRVLRVDPATRAPRGETIVPDVKPCALALDGAPCEPGVIDNRPAPSALAAARSGDVFIADAGQATIWRWRPGQRVPESWYQSTDLAAGDGPAGLAFDGEGRLLFTAGTTLDPNSPGAGALYRLVLDRDGSPGKREFLAGFESNAAPAAIATGRGVPIFVLLRGSGTIVTVANGTVTPFSTAGSPVPVDGPSGLAIHGERLLVTNQSTSNTPSHWAVLSFPINT